MSVRNRVLPAGNQRVFGATVIASVVLFGAACHNGVETPISPSTTTGSVPTATSAALAVDGDTATTRGQGVPGQPIRFILEIEPIETDRFPPGRYTDIAQVDDKGNFRTGGERVTYIDSGRKVTCAVIPYPGETVLAQGQQLTIP